MKRLLVLVSFCLLGAGVSHASELPKNSVEILSIAIAQAKLCGYKTFQVALNELDQEKGEREPAKDGGDALGKLSSGDENYLRALNELRGSILIDPDTRDMHINAAIPEELMYGKFGLTFFKLRKLHILLEQKLHGDKWLPTLFELQIKYWKGFMGLGPTVHEKYIAEFQCKTEASTH